MEPENYHNQMGTDSRETESIELHDLIDNISGIVYRGIFIDSPELRFINSRIKCIAGYSAEDIISGRKDWFSLIHADDRSSVKAAFDRCRRNGRSFEVEYRLLKADGKIAEVLDRVTPAFNGRGEITGFYGLCVDISAQKIARRELERSRTLQNLGKLTAGIAHEIKTPVQFIGDNMRFLADSFKDILKLIEAYGKLRDSVRQSGKFTRELEMIRDAETAADLDFVYGEIPQATAQSIDGVNRVSTMVSAIRDFSHVDIKRFAPGDINRTLHNTVSILRNKLKHTADVNWDLADDLPFVVCCIDDIQQVLLNLIINAADTIQQAISNGAGRGTINMKSRLVRGEVIVTIADTGMGMDSEIKDKIFEPFFTTKDRGEGTGQGLSIVYSIIVEKHGGRIECDSKPGKGSEFRIILPLDRNL